MFLFSLDLQDEQAELQQQQLQRLFPDWNIDSLYWYCFNDPYLYSIGGGFIYEIDCTDIANMEIKSKELLEGYEDEDSRSARNQTVFLNGMIYYSNANNFYRFNVETKAMKKLSLADVIPFDGFEINTLYVTSKNEIRVYGYYLHRKIFFLEITFDDEK